ncbi:hypothetical protein AOCH_005646 [Aspergillus ochraceoroseus]|uniref:Mitochondrial mRNA processing protein n=1 Tax=Aspergillus ochraceoroseus TaxID=138278 RepID=A0A0F8V140_9EURO|nr:hypothetical protein AOCH_005646 [Aspergillus ochraceoroseus]
MFRASLRSVSDPLRDHVCFSCLARSFGARPQARFFYASRVSRAESGDKPEDENAGSAQIKELAVAAEQLKKHQPVAKKKPRSHKGNSGPQDPSKRHDKGADRDGDKKFTKPRKPTGKGRTGNNPKIRLSTAHIGSRDHGKLYSRLGVTEGMAITPLDVERPPVPELSFGLERVLFNPGVYHLRDPRSRVFNFDPYLGSIMPVTEFDFAALKEYITSSKDDILRNIATKEKKKYIGSSSSMTSVLSHFHYLLSAWRPINTETLSQGFSDKMRTFTRLMRAPAAMFLRYQDGVYAIDADKEFDSANILMNLGKSMEKLLTLPKEDFERYRRSSANKITPEEEQAVPEAYHYSTFGDFLMRSQLDAYDPRLPGTGMFDLKTRAVVSIRMDARNFEHGLGYQIKSQYGLFESYEREYFDMIRAAFLKYSLQVRIGRMDGIFVAFHNIERIFGFQYISLPEMDRTLHGQSDTALGDAEFRLSLALWNKILEKATAKFPKQSLRFHFETRDAKVPFMYIFAVPVTDAEIHTIQTKNKAAIDAYQQRVLNLAPHDADEAPPSQVTDETSDDLADEVADAATPDDTSATSQAGEQELFGMVLMIKTFVNGKETERPENLSAKDRWTVEYELSAMQGYQPYALYQACLKRRQKELTVRGEDDSDVAGNYYIRKLRAMSEEGREYRKEQESLDKDHGVIVLNDVKL